MIEPDESDDPLKAIYKNLDELYAQSLNSNDATLSLSNHRAWSNRATWRRGMSHCRICKSKLMYELSKGYDLTKMMEVLHKAHPDIKNIRKYTMNVIRETTGDGRFDDYIVLHKLWKVRKPMMASPEIRKQLQYLWWVLMDEGEVRVQTEKKIERHLKKGDATGDMIRYAMRRR